jgi:sugar phosphate isomerase/epimerase
MAKEDVIGLVQAVDSASGAHGHLPAGQGIFPVVEAVEILKEAGFKGAIISEGHEEDQFQQGRILMESRKAFGSDIGKSYFSPDSGRAQWRDVADQYFGHINPPPYVFGGYRPTEDWVLWSGVPLE